MASPPSGLTVDDIDVFEINEAFASQVSRTRSGCMAPLSCTSCCPGQTSGSRGFR